MDKARAHRPWKPGRRGQHATSRAAGSRSDPAKARRVDIEAFARNLARLIEEGGKALAAYMKPREEGKIKTATSPRTSPTRSRRSARSPNTGWPIRKRALELQASLGRAYLDLWAGAVKRMAGEDRAAGRRARRRATSALPIRNGRRTSSSISSSRPICSPTQWADHLVKDAEGVDPHTRQKAEFYVKQIANAISPSNFVLTNPELLRETLVVAMPRISCAACTCCPRTSRPATAI